MSHKLFFNWQHKGQTNLFKIKWKTLRDFLGTRERIEVDKSYFILNVLFDIGSWPVKIIHVLLFCSFF